MPRGSGFKFVADGWILLLMRFGHEKSRGIELFIGNLQPRIFPETKKMEKVANLSAKPFLVEKLPVVNLTRFFQTSLRVLGRKTDLLTKGLNPPLISFQRIEIIRKGQEDNLGKFNGKCMANFKQF